jgi:flagellar export protein FliJ
MTKRRFTFKLQPLRAVRKHAELAAMRDLAGELRHADELRDELGSAQARLQDARPAEVESGLTAADLAVRQAYVERIEREIAVAESRVALQEGHVEASRSRLETAARERETVDKLETRSRAAHDAETRRLERVANDEISLQMHGRVVA